MNDHIPDVTKMISDTPISDSTPHNVAELGMLCRRLERQINTANVEIERLTAKVAQLYEGAEEAKQRIHSLIAERDTARLQADQKHSLREEFRELLGTDDIKVGVAVVRDLKQLAEVRLGYIKQLTTDIERLTQKVAELYAGAEEQKQGIKRLENAGDALANTQTYDLLETVNWRKSKEAKP